MATTRRVPWVPLGVMILILGLTLFSFLKPDVVWVTPGSPNRPDFEFKDVQITQYLMAKEKFDIHADRGTVDRDSDAVELTNMKGRFYSTQGHSIDVRSPAASLSINGNHLAIKNAEISLSIGQIPARIVTQELRWNTERSQIRCRGGVSVNLPTYAIVGDEFLAVLPIDRYKIFRNAKATMVL